MSRLAERVAFLGSQREINLGAELSAWQSSSAATTIDLEEGDSDFPTPWYISELAVEAIHAGHTHYIDPAGLPALRQQLLDMDWINAAGYDKPSNILVTPGGKFALFAALACLIDPGGGVLIFDPSWPSFDAMVRLLGGVPFHHQTYFEEGFAPGVARLRNEAPDYLRVMIVNSPNNPTGEVYTEADLHFLLEFAEERDLHVISDEVYRDLVFRPSYPSVTGFAQYRDRISTVASFSKGYAMTGWRLGYLVAETALIDKATKVQLHSTTCASSVAQYTALSALSNGALIRAAKEIRAEYKQRRDLVESMLSPIGGLRLGPMAGTPFAWIDVQKLGSNSAIVSQNLLHQYGVAVVPGSAFPGGEGYVRLCYAKAGAEQLREALVRLIAFVSASI